MGFLLLRFVLFYLVRQRSRGTLVSVLFCFLDVPQGLLGSSCQQPEKKTASFHLQLRQFPVNIAAACTRAATDQGALFPPKSVARIDGRNSTKETGAPGRCNFALIPPSSHPSRV